MFLLFLLEVSELAFRVYVQTKDHFALGPVIILGVLNTIPPTLAFITVIYAAHALVESVRPTNVGGATASGAAPYYAGAPDKNPATVDTAYQPSQGYQSPQPYQQPPQSWQQQPQGYPQPQGYTQPQGYAPPQQGYPQPQGYHHPPTQGYAQPYQ